MDLLRRTLSAPEDRLRITCDLYADHLERQRAVEEFWLRVTGLDPSSGAASENARTCSLTGPLKVAVHETRLIQMVLGGIQEIGGFTPDAWLE
jgi:hypothetical protein